MPRLRISLRSLLLGMTLVGCSVWFVLDEGPCQCVGELTTPNSSGLFSLSRDGERVAVDCKVSEQRIYVSHHYVWDVRRKQLLWDTDAVDYVFFLKLSPNGKHLAYVEISQKIPEYYTLVVTNIDSGQSHVLTKTQTEIQDIAFDGNGNVVAVVRNTTGASPAKIKCWNVDSGELFRSHELDNVFKDNVFNLATLSPDGAKVAAVADRRSVDRGGTLTVWDTVSAERKWQREYERCIRVARWSADAKTISVVERVFGKYRTSYSDHLQVLAAETGVEQCTIKRIPDAIVSPDLTRAVSQHEPVIFRMEDGEELATLDSEMGERMHFSEDGRHLISTWFNGIEIWRRVRPEGLIGYAYDYRAWLAGCSLLALLASLAVDAVPSMRRAKPVPSG